MIIWCAANPGSKSYLAFPLILKLWRQQISLCEYQRYCKGPVSFLAFLCSGQTLVASILVDAGSQDDHIGYSQQPVLFHEGGGGHLNKSPFIIVIVILGLSGWWYWLFPLACPSPTPIHLIVTFSYIIPSIHHNRTIRHNITLHYFILPKKIHKRTQCCQLKRNIRLLVSSTLEYFFSRSFRI